MSFSLSFWLKMEIDSKTWLAFLTPIWLCGLYSLNALLLTEAQRARPHPCWITNATDEGSGWCDGTKEEPFRRRKTQIWLQLELKGDKGQKWSWEEWGSASSVLRRWQTVHSTSTVWSCVSASALSVFLSVCRSVYLHGAPHASSAVHCFACWNLSWGVRILRTDALWWESFTGASIWLGAICGGPGALPLPLLGGPGLCVCLF